MKILGIDPGIARLGFGLIKASGNKISCLNFGCLETTKNLPQANRLEIIYKNLSKIIEKESPDLLAVEKIFFSKNAKTALTISETRGVILLLAKQNNLKIKEITPIEVKQAITSYGRADKNQVGLMVKKLLNLKEIPKPDDTADALAIAISASFINNVF